MLFNKFFKAERNDFSDPIGKPWTLQDVTNDQQVINNIESLVENNRLDELYIYAQSLFSEDSKVGLWCVNFLAGKGHTDSAFDLAYFYGEGKYTKKNINKSIELYKICANSGMTVAQYNLSLMYEELGDKTNEFYWIKTAAENGYKDAFPLYAIKLEKTDYEEAIRWYIKAGEAGIPGAYHNAAYICEELGRYEEMVEYFISDVNLGEVGSANDLGQFYHERVKNFQEAQYWYEYAFQRGHLPAAFNLGLLFLDIKQMDPAVNYLKIAADGGIKEARDLLKKIEHYA